MLIILHPELGARVPYSALGIENFEAGAEFFKCRFKGSCTGTLDILPIDTQVMFVCRC